MVSLSEPERIIFELFTYGFKLDFAIMCLIYRYLYFSKKVFESCSLMLKGFIFRTFINA